MSEWPRGMVVAPIGSWPGTLRAAGTRKLPPFESTRKTQDRGGRARWERKAVSLTDTLALLDRELDALRATEIELLVAIPREQFRLDGRPRADAKPQHPGVILSFTTTVGHLSYPCDTFMTWQGNLRAVALALEALRKVDRYGVTSHGEQYRGFLAIESASSGDSVAEARRLLTSIAGGAPDVRTQVRRAKVATHPDLHPELGDYFQRVLEAERVLRESGDLS